MRGRHGGRVRETKEVQTTGGIQNTEDTTGTQNTEDTTWDRTDGNTAYSIQHTVMMDWQDECRIGKGRLLQSAKGMD